MIKIDLTKAREKISRALKNVAIFFLV